MSIRDAIAETLEDALFLDPSEIFDKAIIGIAERFGGVAAVCYDRHACIRGLMGTGDMTWEEAEEFFEFNTIGAWVGDRTPIFLTVVKGKK